MKPDEALNSIDMNPMFLVGERAMMWSVLINETEKITHFRIIKGPLHLKIVRLRLAIIEKRLCP